MQSSRVFVRGLPPDITPAHLRHQFSETAPVTDVKCIPQRRIGYVGYKSSADAAKAIKHYNKSFIRMSRIYVELARPVEDRRALQLQPNSTNVKPDTAEGKNAATENTKKRKRDDGNAQLQAFLGVMEPPSRAKLRTTQEPLNAQPVSQRGTRRANPALEEAQSDEEYEAVSQERLRPSKPKLAERPLEAAEFMPFTSEHQPTNPLVVAQSTDNPQNLGTIAPVASDEDWLRSRTSRLLGLQDDSEALMPRTPVVGADSNSRQRSPTTKTANAAAQAEVESDCHAYPSMPTPKADNEDAALESGRLFVRNLAYAANEEELRYFFESQDFGPIEEVYVPLDHRSGTGKGYAYVQYATPQAARRALDQTDGTSFQGRLLHIIPAARKKQTGLDEFANSKLPLKKQQQIRRKTEAASSTFNWNAMFMNVDAVMSSISERLGVPKSELLDPTSSDTAVKQAHAETHIIQDTKAYFTANGVDLNAFKKTARGDTTILVKNFSFETKVSDLKALFEGYGTVLRLLVPPSGTIAIVEFKHADDARSAFAGLAYRKVKNSILFLEKAPRGIFSGVEPPADGGKMGKPSSANVFKNENSQKAIQSSTLFVRNLNFTTTTERLHEIFEPLDGFLSARVKMKPDPKKFGQFLSMGFGFLEFRTKQQAQAALTVMNDYTLDGHKLFIQASQKATDAAEERRKEDNAKKVAGRKTKIIIKNLPFEASRKDVRSLLAPYGQLRSVRVPKKFDTSTRGFAFAEFVTAKEAENAFDALKDTHLLGRKLVLEFTAEDAIDPELGIAKMQEKVAKQADKVALQKLTGTGRKKFDVKDDEEAES